MSKIDELRLGFETAYIDGSVVSNNIYRPQFVSNNHKEGNRVDRGNNADISRCRCLSGGGHC